MRRSYGVVVKLGEVIVKCLLLVIVLFFSSNSMRAKGGDTFQVQLEEGVTAWFTILSEEEKTCQIGLGVTDYNSSTIPDGTIGKITIPGTVNGYTVTTIGWGAFMGCSDITNVVIPNTIRKIQPQAFRESGLTSIDIPSSVKEIIGAVFCDCSQLKSVVLHDGLLSIGSSGFSNCTSLSSIIIPKSVQTISNYAFSKCTALSSVTIDNASLTIGKSAFSNCEQLSSFVMGNAVTSIGGWAFDGCSMLPSIDFSETLTQIGEYAFNKCGLTSVTIPGNVETIEDYSFSQCSQLASVTFGEGIKNINRFAFANCSKLKDIYFPTSLLSIGESAFVGASIEEVRFPDRLESIGANAFSKCEALSSLYFGKGLKFVGSSVFYNCSKISYVDIGDLANWCQIEFDPDYGINSYDSNFGRFVCPANPLAYTRKIYLNGEPLDELDIPSTVTAIKNFTFNNVIRFDKVIIPNTIKSIGRCAFSGCTDLSQVYFLSGQTLESIGDDAFQGCINLLEIGLPSTINKLGGAFRNCTNLETVNIPENIIEISDYTFYNCSKLADISIPEGVKTIGSWAFSGCISLSRIIIPSSVEIIGTEAFGNCEGLGGVYIKDLAKWCGIKFGNSQYQGNTYATSDKQTNPLIYGTNLYVNNQLVTDLIIPDGVETIEDFAFWGAGMISSVTIPNSVKSIGKKAFSTCANLRSIFLPSTIEGLDEETFFELDKQCPKAVYKESSNKNNVKVYINDIGNWITKNYGSAFSHMGSYGKIQLELYLNGEPVTDLVVPSNITELGEYVFTYVKMNSVVLHKNVESVHWSNFQRSTITTIYSYAKFAPTFNNVSSYFNLTPLTAIYVPKGRGENYKNNWPTHANIIFEMEDSPSEVLSFVDSEVKQICVDNWDIDGNGEFSEDEAKAVTDLNNVFKNNTIITSFDELKYFTGLKAIYYGDFDGCTNLETITLPASLEVIGDAPFGNCNALKSIVIPASVKKIGKANIGTYLWNLESIQVEEGNTVYDSRDNCNAIIETASNKLIAGCQSTVIPDDVTTIAAWAFNTCMEKTIVIPEGVTTIEKNAFMGNHFKTIVMPSTLTSMTWAFQGCSLKLVESHITNPFALDELTFDMAANAVLYVPKGTKDKYEAMEGWKKFSAIIEIEEETADNILNFEDEAVKQLCLANWDVNASGELSFNEAAGILNLERVFYTSNISKFQELKYFTRLKSISEYAFRESGLSSVVLPQSVESIDHGAFLGCKMTEIDIPASVTSIGENAFLRCKNLTSVNVNWMEPVAIDEKAFPTRANIVLNVPVGTKAAYQDASYWKDFKDILSIYEGASGIYSIEDNDATLTDGSNMVQKETVIPSSITIDGEEFAVTAIGENAFANNTEMTQLTIPESISEIGQGAFAGCSALEVIYNYRKEPIPLGNAVAAARTRGADGSDVFAGVNKETCVLYVPAGSKSKYAAADGWKEFQTIKEFGVVATKPGDANSDEKINVADIVEIVNFMKKTPSEHFNEANADVNADGDVDDEDIKAIEDYLLNVEPKTLKELKAQVNLGGDFSGHLGWYVDGEGNISSSDADAVGRICYISTSDVDIAFVGSRILVLANEDITNQHGITWGVYGEPMHLTATKEPEGLCGYNNTNTLQAFGHERKVRDAAGTKVEYESGYPAACYAWNYSGAKPVGASHWFLPSFIQCKKMLTAARKSGTGQLSSGKVYWSSTDNSGNFAYFYTLSQTGDNPKDYTLNLDPDYEESWKETWEKWSTFGVRACYAY